MKGGRAWRLKPGQHDAGFSVRFKWPTDKKTGKKINAQVAWRQENGKTQPERNKMV